MASSSSNASAMSHLTSSTTTPFPKKHQGSSPSSSSSSSSGIMGPKQCRCYALQPTSDCYGAPFGIDLMSRKAVPPVSTAKREQRAKIDLQQHTRRMGWGVPMPFKPRAEQQQQLQQQQSKQPQGGRHGKGVAGAGGGAGKGPVLHRATSTYDARLHVHPLFGTLDSGASQQAAQKGGEGNEEGGEWWRGEFVEDDGGGGDDYDEEKGEEDEEGGGGLEAGASRNSRALEDGEEVVGDVLGVGGVSSPDPVLHMLGTPSSPFNKREVLPAIGELSGGDRGGGGRAMLLPGSKEGNAEFPSALDDPDLVLPSQANYKLTTPSSPGVQQQQQQYGEAPNIQVSSHNSLDFKLEQCVDAALFASWKALPWQSRVCPRALEERESVRLLAAMVQEARRTRIWREEQQNVARDRAKREDERFKRWALEERRRVGSYEEEERERVRVFEFTKKQQVDAFEESELQRVVLSVEAGERLRVLLQLFDEFRHVSASLHAARDAALRKGGEATPAWDVEARLEEVRGEDRRSAGARERERAAVQRQTVEEERRALQMYEAQRNRVQLADDDNRRVTQELLSNFVALTAHITDEEEEVAVSSWQEEVLRVETCDVEETNRVSAWESLQAAVTRAARLNVLRLLGPDSGAVDYDDECERSKYYCNAYKGRTKVEKDKYMRQRILAKRQADNVSRTWRGALAKWRDTSADLHQRRARAELERVSSNAAQEAMRVAMSERAEADRVEYAWDRECQRVKRWKDEESIFVYELINEWSRGAADFEQALNNLYEQCLIKVENIEEKFKANSAAMDAGSDKVRQAADEEIRNTLNHVADVERELLSNVRDFESAQLLMVLGVSNQLVNNVNDLFRSSATKRNFSAGHVLDLLATLSKTERSRIGAAYRVEIERVNKSVLEQERNANEEMKSIMRNCEVRFEDLVSSLASFLKDCNMWSTETAETLSETVTKWQRAQETVVTNELLRIFGSDAYRRSLTLPKPPSQEQLSALTTMTRSDSSFNAGNNQEEVVTSALLDDPVGADGIGRRVQVYWQDDDEWFEGTIDDFVPDDGDELSCIGWHVTYEDGDEEWLDHRLSEGARDYRFVPLESSTQNQVTAEGLAAAGSSSLTAVKAVSPTFDGQIVDIGLLNSWRCKTTSELFAIRRTIIGVELQRQSKARELIIARLHSAQLEALKKAQAELVSNLNHSFFLERSRVSERNEKEKARVASRQAMELKSWEQYVAAVELITKNNVECTENIVNQYKTWASKTFAELRASHLQRFKRNIADDEKISQDTIAFRKQDLEVKQRHGVEDVNGLLSSFLSGLEPKMHKFEDTKAAAETKLRQQVRAALAGTTETAEHFIAEAVKSAEKLASSADGVSESELAAFLTTVKGEMSRNGASVIKSIDETVSHLNAVDKELLVELQAVFKKLGTEYGSTFDELFSQLTPTAEKCILGMRAKHDEAVEKEKQRIKASEVLASEKLDVMSREAKHEAEAKINQLTQLCNKYDEARKLSLKEELDSFEVFAAEFKQVCEAYPGNSNIEEQIQMIGKICEQKKEMLISVADVGRQQLLDELTMQKGEAVASGDEHVSELRNAQREFLAFNEKITAAAEAEEAELLTQYSQGLQQAALDGCTSALQAWTTFATKHSKESRVNELEGPLTSWSPAMNGVSAASFGPLDDAIKSSNDLKERVLETTKNCTTKLKEVASKVEARMQAAAAVAAAAAAAAAGGPTSPAAAAQRTVENPV